MPGTKYDEEDTTFHPSSMLDNIKNIVALISYCVICVLLSCLTVYLIVCISDNRVPTQIYEYQASDTYIGGKIPVHLAGYRTRKCEITLYRYATDANGNVIFESTIGRPINGDINKPLKLDDSFQMNDRAVPGRGIMHQLFQWRCPYNIIHKYVNPLELEITDDFMIYQTKTEWDKVEQEKKAKKDLKERKD